MAIEFWALCVFVAIAFAIGVAVRHERYWVRRLSLELEYELVEKVEAPDGGVFELRRLPRKGASDGEPILLVHGVACNHRNQDVHPDYSLARYLASLGRDVWL